MFPFSAFIYQESQFAVPPVLGGGEEQNILEIVLGRSFNTFLPAKDTSAVSLRVICRPCLSSAGHEIGKQTGSVQRYFLTPDASAIFFLVFFFS